MFPFAAGSHQRKLFHSYIHTHACLVLGRIRKPHNFSDSPAHARTLEKYTHRQSVAFFAPLCQNHLPIHSLCMYKYINQYAVNDIELVFIHNLRGNNYFNF